MRQAHLRKKHGGEGDDRTIRGLMGSESVIAPFGETFVTIREGDEDPFVCMIRTDTKSAASGATRLSPTGRDEQSFLPEITPAGADDPRAFFDRVRKDQLEKRKEGSPLRETLLEMRGDVEAEVDVLARRRVVRSFAKDVASRGLI